MPPERSQFLSILALPAGALLALSMASHATAQTAPATVQSLAATVANMPKNLPRAKAPDLSAAIDAGRAAVSACRTKGALISVIVADTAGNPVVLLSGDGAGVRSQLIAQTKINIVVRYKTSSGDVADKAKADPSLDKAAAADPNIGMLRAGGLPVVRAGEMIGIVGVSGASLASGDLTLDEACAKVAVQRLEGR